MNWMVRTASEVETNIVSVERVEEYASVDQEVKSFNDSLNASCSLKTKDVKP